MKAKKDLTLPASLIRLIERDAPWATFCNLKPVELKRVDYADGRTGYIATIRVGMSIYDLYTAEIDLGVCKTNRDLEEAFCVRVGAHLSRITSSLDVAEWYAKEYRRRAMEYAVKCYQENPLTWREEADDDDDAESCQIPELLNQATTVFNRIETFAAILKDRRSESKDFECMSRKYNEERN